MATEKKTPVKKDQKNGVTRPKEGSTTRKVWDISDKLKTRAEVLKECAKRKINAATATTQFGKWRVYMGLKGKKTVKAAKKIAPKKKSAAKKAPPAAPAPAAESAPQE